MTGVTCSVFDWIDHADVPLHQLYEERLQLVEAAEAAGFYSYHLAEHHGTTLGMAPSPALFLAAAAQRTKTIRLGPMAYLLPLYHPLRLIEEVCMLDHLSGGRLDLGIARGVSPYEVSHYGVDPNQTREMFREALSVFIEGCTHERLSHEGRYYRYQDVPMELRPLQKPYPPLWYPTANIDSIPFAAEYGLHTMGNGSAEQQAAFVERYHQVWQEQRDGPHRLNSPVVSPWIGLNRHVFIADTDEEAEAIARPAYAVFYANYSKLWREHNTTPSARGDFDAACREGTAFVGSPDRVREQVMEMLTTSGCNYFAPAFAWGSLTLGQSLRSLRLFAEHVMPAFATNKPLATNIASSG